MKIKRIEFMEEITDIHNDSIDVLVENEDGYNYIIDVGTPQDLLEEMNQDKQNNLQLHKFSKRKASFFMKPIRILSNIKKNHGVE